MAAAQTATREDAPRRNVTALGEILWLLGHSELHLGWRMRDIELYVFPALTTNRYKIYKRDGRPIGYVSIALLSKAVEDCWLAGGYLLQADDWISGDRPWIMDFITPFGDSDEVGERVHREPETFGKLVRALRPNKGGQGLRIVSFGPRHVRKLDDWPRRLVNQPAGTAAPSGRRRSPTPEDRDTPPGVAKPLPHVRDLLWTTPENWLIRCCGRHKYAEYDF